MEITEEKQANHYIFRLNGRLDSNTSQAFEQKLFEAIDSGNLQLIIDCARLDYITSAGLRVLNKSAKRLKRDSGKIVLCAMADYVREVFEIAGFDTFLPIVGTLDDASARLAE